MTSCGSGAVSGSAPVNDPTRITILPAIATAFSGLPTTFVISGGTGSYIVSSSNQSIVQVAGSLNGSTLTIIPNPVLTDTTVTLTVRDTGTTPTASATVTVRPGTVINNITITPSSTQGGSCAPAICSGGDAEIDATISQGGSPLAARGVRFDVTTGDFRFVTSPLGASSETLATTITVITDETGKARARIRATSGASNQTVLLKITDLGSAAFQDTSFVIAQATGTSPGFFVTPQSVTFQGRRADVCADSSINATFFVFGGVAPYTVSSTSSAFIVFPLVVQSNGGSFTVTPNGQCVATPGAPIVVRDSSGRSVTVTAANVRGVDAVPALAVTPGTVSLTSCTSVATVTVAGGTGNYFASSGSGNVLVTQASSNTFRIQRDPSSTGGADPSTVSVGISDGVSTTPVTVTLSGNGAGVCPTPNFLANPMSVTVSSCSGAAQVLLSGGSGTYNAASGDSAVTATVSGNVLSIKRTAGSLAFGSGTVTATDGFSNQPITVTGAGTGTGSGTGSCP